MKITAACVARGLLALGLLCAARVGAAFPVRQHACFYRLRTFGAFLISGAINQGMVQPHTMESEQGRPCNRQNPWPGQTVQVVRQGRKSACITGAVLRLATAPGEELRLAPAGLPIAMKNLVRPPEQPARPGPNQETR